MKKTLVLVLVVLCILAPKAQAQDASKALVNNDSKAVKLERPLPVLWEDLTALDFKLAVERSGGVCIIPMGVLEKHGPHMPLGTDVFVAREVSILAAQQEYALVFPFYWFGQIYEARHQPGTIAYSPELLYNVLDETCRELARNGVKKIILYNYHGGSRYFLYYFCQTQLSSTRDYVVYLAEHKTEPEVQQKIDAMVVNHADGHADETEASILMAFRPDLVFPQRADLQSGEDMERFPRKNYYASIWWYASFPNHYSGNGIAANAPLGRILLDNRVEVLKDIIKSIKADNNAPALQKEFFKDGENPLETIQ